MLKKILILVAGWCITTNAFVAQPRSNIATLQHKVNSREQYANPSISKSQEYQKYSSTTQLFSSQEETPKTSSNFNLDLILRKATTIFPLWVLAACVLGLKTPAALAWVNQGQLIEMMLALVMIGMGMTLQKKDFTSVLSKNWSSIPLGVICQFGIMPAAAWFIGSKFLLGVDPSLFLGLVLVGCSPGGTASNLVCFIAGANVALSVLLTTFSTILASAATPLLVKYLVGGTEIMVSGIALCRATAKVVLGPVLLGMLINTKLPKISKSISRFTPFASVLLVAIICGGVMTSNAPALASIGAGVVPAVVGSVFLTHGIGFLAGYAVTKFIGRKNKTTARTISIETGMQNSALAVVLAQSIGAPPLAALPGAISALMHSCMGSILASYWTRKNGGSTLAIDDRGFMYEI
eukprot:CAMPEP_0194219636 /NCGR_PEP_ID=MMETSP0156-20130528/26437_1 /TAXON_ID=33649 /ORGANISM="Thalassionema nitzschioides, Strain L26-B" /LENGTH=407 /DNA_ID=CAMNT_0038949387 /DNA_START=32 /DNA_END=1255 /DNA_ORIENTATION=-